MYFGRATASFQYFVHNLYEFLYVLHIFPYYIVRRTEVSSALTLQVQFRPTNHLMSCALLQYTTLPYLALPDPLDLLCPILPSPPPGRR